MPSNTVNLVEEFIINLEEETVEVIAIENLTFDLVEDTVNVVTKEEIITITPTEEVLNFSIDEIVEIYKTYTNLNFSLDDITAPTVVAQHLTKGVSAVRFILYVRSRINPTRKRHLHILAFHNGDLTTDADEVKSSCAGVMSFGDPISGFDFNITLTGTGLGQTLNLVISSTENVDIRGTADITEI